MIFIAHRGNINGPNPSKENRIDYVYEALEKGYDVEIDVWYEDKQWWLGHDKPKWKSGSSIFRNPKVWCHAKNNKALYELNNNVVYNFFWQENDDYTLTSRRFIWCHSNVVLLPNSICVMPEKGYKGYISKCYGVCSDYATYV